MNSLLTGVLLFATSLAAYSADPTVVVREVTEVLEVKPVKVNGVLRNRRDLFLPSTMDGELLWVLEEGELVAPGMTVAKVDDMQLKLQLAEQELLRTRARINSDYLEEEVVRLQALEKTKLASRTQLAEMVSRRDLSISDVAVAGARVAQLQENIRKTDIVTPEGGVVVERLLQGGEYARRGESVVRVVNPDSLEIKVSIPVDYLRRLARDRPVDVIVNQLTFTAALRSVIHAGNQTSQTFDAIIDVPPEYCELLVGGQFAEVSLPLLRAGKRLYVPRDAVVLRSEGNFVFRIGNNNVAEKISVTLGEGQGDLVSVLGDLAVGDRVAVRGVERLQDGQAVSPVG